jgi:hypothetical protein
MCFSPLQKGQSVLAESRRAEIKKQSGQVAITGCIKLLTDGVHGTEGHVSASSALPGYPFVGQNGN